MGIRRAAFVMLALCVIGGLVATLFSPSIQIALTVPAALRSNPPAISIPGQQSPAAPARTTIPPTPTPAATATTPAVMPAWMSILARDTFQRGDQPLWGLASDGQMWGGDANTSPVFSIAGNAGEVTGGQGIFNAILGQANTNTEAVVTASISHFASGVNIGAVLRWTDTNNWYKALINGSDLVIMKRTNGVTSTLGQIPFTAHEGISYIIRFRAMGAMLFAKVWPGAQPEPPNWMLTVTDTDHPSGFGGMRIAIQPGIIVKVTSFSVTAITEIT